MIQFVDVVQFGTKKWVIRGFIDCMGLQFSLAFPFKFDRLVRTIIAIFLFVMLRLGIHFSFEPDLKSLLVLANSLEDRFNGEYIW